MRHAAQYVDARIQEHKNVTGKENGYLGGQQILVAVSEAAGCEQVVRAAKRLADALKAPMVALYIETPGAARFSDAEKTQLARNLSLAASLGATLQPVPATSVQEAMLSQCRETRWQVYDWRKKLRTGQLLVPEDVAALPMFAELVVEGPAAAMSVETEVATGVEIVVGDVVIRVGADADEALLTRSIRAVRAAT